MLGKIVETGKNAMKLAQSGEPDGAIEHLELLFETGIASPDKRDLRLLMGPHTIILENQGKLGLALNYACKTALAKPEDQRIQFMMAGLLQRSGKVDEAKSAHERCLQLCITNKDEELLELLNLNSESDL